MIKRKLKYCKGCHQLRYLFSHGLCEYCDKKRKQETRGKLYIKPQSDRRAIEAVTYKRICDLIDDEARETKQLGCIFCGRDVSTPCDHHHVDGRSEYYLMKAWIKRAHGSCHRMYHDTSIHTWPWLDGFLLRMKGIDRCLYEKELRRLDK